ncbi:unnamed protein product, partial [Ascophyllum nodosum]
CDRRRCFEDQTARRFSGAAGWNAVVKRLRGRGRMRRRGQRGWWRRERGTRAGRPTGLR